MPEMDRAWLNKINRSSRIDPQRALKNLREIEVAIADVNLDDKVRALRTTKLKRERELREACLFAHGMSCRQDQKIWVYPVEDADFDFVASWDAEPVRHFAPVQLKELVPSNLNPYLSLQAIVDALTSYTSPTLTIAVHYNREDRFDARKVQIPPLKVAALWVFGAVSPDQSKWMLYGNMLEDAEMSWFDYPI